MTIQHHLSLTQEKFEDALEVPVYLWEELEWAKDVRSGLNLD